MPAALKEVLARIETLTEHLDPEGQAFALKTLESLAAQLEADRKWDDLLASPESQQYLLARGKEVMKELEAGELLDGDWEE